MLQGDVGEVCGEFVRGWQGKRERERETGDIPGAHERNGVEGQM